MDVITFAVVAPVVIALVAYTVALVWGSRR